MRKNFLHTALSLTLLFLIPIVGSSQGLNLTIALEAGSPPARAQSPRWIFTMTFINGAVGAYKTDHFQLFTSIPGSFDPTNDNCMFQYSRYGGGAGTFSIFGDTPYFPSDYGPWSAWNSGIVENSQCRVWSQHATQSIIGNDLKLTFPVEAKGLMEGKYGIYVEHGTWGGYSNGWNGFGNYYTPLWQPINLPLPNLPTKTFLQTFGIGMSTVLDSSMSSTGAAGNGVKALTRALLIANTTSAPSGVNACYAIYHRTSHELQMLDDGGNNSLGIRLLGNVPGISNVVQGNQCAMDLGLSWYDETSTSVRLLVPVTFTSSFANRPGVKNLFFVPIDRAGQIPATSSSDGTWPASNVPISDFSLSIPSNSAIIMAGTTTVSYNIVVNPINGFAGILNFSAVGLPGGASATFNPAAIVGSGSTTMTLNTSTVKVGTYSFSVSGQSGAISRGISASVAVQDFAFTISPSSRTVQPSGIATYTISSTGMNGYNQPISISGLSNIACPGYSATNLSIPVWPSSIAANGLSNFSVTSFSSPSVPLYNCLQVTGTSGGVTHQAFFSLTTNPNASPNADFSVSVSAAQAVMAPGVASYGISISSVNSFTGSIGLSATGPGGSALPAGISASFTQSIIPGGTGTTNLLLSAQSSTLPGTYAIEIKGVGGTIQHLTTTYITVQSTQTFTISATPGIQTTTQTGGVGYTVFLNTNQGFSGSLILSATGLPPGANATFNPATITSSGSAGVTITTSSTPLGNYPITLRATSGVTTRTADALLIVSASSPAKVISPGPGSTLTSAAVTFTWDSGVGASQYQLLLGSAPGASDYLSTLPTAAQTVSTALPGPTRTLYATLSSLVGGIWQPRSYIYTIGQPTSGDTVFTKIGDATTSNYSIPNNNVPTKTGPFFVANGNGTLATSCAMLVSNLTTSDKIVGELSYPSFYTSNNSSSYDVTFQIPPSVKAGSKSMVCTVNKISTTNSNYLYLFDGSPVISGLSQFDPEYSGGPFYVSVFGSNFGPVTKTLTVCASDPNPATPCNSTPDFNLCLPLAGSIVNPSCPYSIWKDDQINVLLTPTSSAFGTYDVQVTSFGSSGSGFLFNPQAENSAKSNRKGTIVKDYVNPQGPLITVSVNGQIINPSDTVTLDANNPDLNVLATIVGQVSGTSSWRLQSSYKDSRDAHAAYISTFPAASNAFQDQAAASPFQLTTAMGGQATLLWKLNGVSQKNFPFTIKGSNPTKSVVKSYMVAASLPQNPSVTPFFLGLLPGAETVEQTQFYASGNPIWGGPSGYGLLQIDPPQSTAEIFHWKNHVDTYINVKLAPKKTAAYTFWAIQVKQYKDYLDTNPAIVPYPPVIVVEGKCSFLFALDNDPTVSVTNPSGTMDPALLPALQDPQIQGGFFRHLKDSNWIKAINGAIFYYISWIQSTTGGVTGWVLNPTADTAFGPINYVNRVCTSTY